MSKTTKISRRRFLRGVGVSLALPTLEAMNPAPMLAGPQGIGMPKKPVRLAFCYVPNGVIVKNWRMKKMGKLSELSPTLKPLQKFTDDIQVLNGLHQNNARRQKGEPPGGAHSRSGAAFLTGCKAFQSEGAEIKLGISMDQVAAQKIGHLTRLPSIELNCDRKRKAGMCERGYSCAYQYNLSWRGPTTPVAYENNPRLAFERLFGSGISKDESRNQNIRNQYDKSILDFVMADAADLQRSLGRKDQQKLDEYLTSVREIERRIESAGKFKVVKPNYKAPKKEIPVDYQEHIRLMFDIMRLAFQTDSTRIATFMLAHELSGRKFTNLGISEGHHILSHHRNETKAIKQVAMIDKFYVEQFAYFLEELKKIPEGEGTLLDNCMIVYGSAISDGNTHSNSNLPLVLAGGGGGTFKQGRNVDFNDSPMCNLHLSLLERMNVNIKRFGDSTGKLKGL